MYNTRIAPSPTGNMHLGTARTAYFSWLAARSTGGKFILRIDDTDLERSDPKYTDVILETMDWLGLDYDLLVYQSNRFDRYREVANKLIVKDQATELENGAIGLSTDIIPTEWHDEAFGTLTVSEREAELSSGLILIKGDGSPTYHFASVVDDVDFGINYIIRGQDHIQNTTKQISLFRNLAGDANAPIPKFAHVGLIHHHKKKLSKRDDAASMLYYRDAGYDPDAMLNFLLRLGWGPTNEGKEHKVIDKEFALKIFLNGGNLRSQSSNMDLSALESYDRKYKARKTIWRNKDVLSED